MKAVIGISLYNRYSELLHNLSVIKKCMLDELKEEGRICICWARYDEEPNKQLQKDIIDEIRAIVGENIKVTIIKRNGLPKEGTTGSTYPESHNIQILLSQLEEDEYLIFQDADVYPKQGIYETIDYAMNKGYYGVFFSMDNVKCVMHSCQGLYESKIFAVNKNLGSLFPVVQVDEPNIMEWHIGMTLRTTKYPYYILYDYISQETNGLFFKVREFV